MLTLFDLPGDINISTGSKYVFFPMMTASLLSAVLMRQCGRR